MDAKMKNKLILWMLSSVILVIAFFVGLFISISAILGIVIIPLLIIINYFSLNILENHYNDSIGNEKILV